MTPLSYFDVSAESRGNGRKLCNRWQSDMQKMIGYRFHLKIAPFSIFKPGSFVPDPYRRYYRISVVLWFNIIKLCKKGQCDVPKRIGYGH